MAGRKVPRPTEAELDILNVLWTSGPMTVREVHSEIEQARGQSVVYTTVLKLLQIMAEKGLVTREESSRAHVYEAAVPQKQMQQRLLSELREKLFGGSAAQLVMQALSGKAATRKELRAIRELLDQYERGER